MSLTTNFMTYILKPQKNTSNKSKIKIAGYSETINQNGNEIISNTLITIFSANKLLDKSVVSNRSFSITQTYKVFKLSAQFIAPGVYKYKSNSPLPSRTISKSPVVQSTIVEAMLPPYPPSITISTRSWYFS